MRRWALAGITLSISGCLFFGGSDALRPLRVDRERPGVRTFLVQSRPSDAFANLALELSRQLASTGVYGALEIVERAQVQSLLSDPFTWRQEGRVLIVRPEPLRLDVARSTRIPYLWNRVAPTSSASAIITVFSSDHDMLLPGARITGRSRGGWSHRLLSNAPPKPPPALELRRLEAEAITDLARRIGLELGRFESEAGQQLAASGGPS